jgi:TonB family protein
VEVQFTVSARGEVREFAVLDDSPKNLEQALRSAVRQWRFEPVLYNGGPIPVRSSVRFTFQN